MTLASPAVLLLALLPLAGLLWPLWGTGSRHWRKDRPAWPAALRAVVRGGEVRLSAAARAQLPCAAFWVGALLLILALARPQWGVREELSSGQGEVVIALDLSRSMGARDSVPSRLEQARAIAAHLVAQLPAAKIGLIGFAGRAYLLAAPSADRAQLQSFLPAVELGQMVVPGTNFAKLLETTLHAFSPQANSRILVLLSDGEADPTPWRHLLPQLRSHGICVMTVGLGSPQGAPVRLDDRELTDATGAPVISRLVADTLQDLSRATGGTYLAGPAAGELPARVQSIAQHTSSLKDASANGARGEQFVVFLWPALLLLMWSAIREWPARVCLSRAARWRSPAIGVAVAMLGLTLTLVSSRGEAMRPQDAKLQTSAVADPLSGVKISVARALSQRAPSAQDYLALAQATVRYGQAHRLQSLALQGGVLRDGLAAIDAGKQLDPRRPGWDMARETLLQLLTARPPTDDAEEGDGDPNGPQVDPKTDPAPDEAGYNPNGKPQDSRSVGGTPTSASRQADWRVPSLVKPLDTLNQLRAADQPGELFHLLQLVDPAPQGPQGQTW